MGRLGAGNSDYQIEKPLSIIHVAVDGFVFLSHFILLLLSKIERNRKGPVTVHDQEINRFN